MSLIINWWNIVVLALGLVATFWCNNKYNESKSRPLLTSLPGVWTSLGLLGTFLAICISLHNVKTTGGEDLDILELIRKLVPAFTTSIIGLVGALVVTIWSKIKFAEEEVIENRFLGNKTPEEYIRDVANYTKEITSNKSIIERHNELLSELIQLHKEQEEKNREYNEKLNDNISHQSEILKEFIDGFVNRMDEIFKQMHGAIQQQVQNFGEEQFTKTSQVLTSITERLSPSPEPNLTVLYSSKLTDSFKRYAAKISILTSSIQYENDDIMKVYWGDDYAICCCVSATQTGKEMQFFGARANLAKALLYAINGGMDDGTNLKKGPMQVAPKYQPITSEYLDYDEVIEKYDVILDWLASLYVNTLNLIQYMHDKYFYEAAEMALIDTDVRRTFATGIAGFSHVVDSLSAIKYAKVKTIRNEQGLVVDYEVTGDFPKYGNNDDRADDIALWLLKTFLEKIKKNHTYRNSEATTSILTITSNVVYGKFTGNLPDGRRAGEPLAPGANPSYGAEQNGLLASLNSLAKLPYGWALDGISNTQTMNPDALGHSEEERVTNLVTVMDGYFDQGAHHLNVNVFGKEKLLDAMEHPEKPEYANFTIRVSGYAVKFIDLTKEQQRDVISRTFHERM